MCREDLEPVIWSHIRAAKCRSWRSSPLWTRPRRNGTTSRPSSSQAWGFSQMHMICSASRRSPDWSAASTTTIQALPLPEPFLQVMHARQLPKKPLFCFCVALEVVSYLHIASLGEFLRMGCWDVHLVNLQVPIRRLTQSRLSGLCVVSCCLAG